MTVEVFEPAPIYTIAGTGPYAVPHPYTLGGIRVSVVTDREVIAVAPDGFTTAPEAAETSGDVYLTAAIAALHVGQRLLIERETIDEQGWTGLLGERERGLETQLDGHTMAIQELRRSLGSTVRTIRPIQMITPQDGRSLIFDGGNIVPGPSAAEIENAGENAAIAAAAAAEAEAILTSTLRVFPSVAALAAYTGHVAGRTVTTTGYFTPGDGGGGEFEIIPAGADDPVVPSSTPYVVVGDGQSNMAGKSGIGGTFKSNPDVYVWLATTLAGVPSWVRNPNFATTTYYLPTTDAAYVPVGGGSNNLALSFAHRMQEDLKRPVYVILNARGSQALNNWVSGGVSSPRYASLRSVVTAALAAAPAGVSAIDAFLWHQGESDAGTSAATHVGKLETLYSQLTAEPWWKPSAPFIAGQLLRSQQNYNSVRIGVQRFIEVDPAKRKLASASGLPGEADNIHFTGESLWQLGYDRYFLALHDGVVYRKGRHDGGSYISLHGSGLQARGVFDGHKVPCERFGAVDGVEASAAINAANAFAVSQSFLLTAAGAGPASRSRLKLTMASAVQIANAVMLSTVDGFNMDVDFRGSLIVCIAGGNLMPTEAAITVYGSSSIRNLCRVHCNKLCSGYEIKASANSTTYGVHARWIASHVDAFGVREGRANRGHILFHPIATEWEANNVEADDTNAYLATGVVLDGFDSVVMGGHPGFCGIAYRFTGNAGLVQLIQPHPFCNNPRNQTDFPRQDPIAIYNQSGNRNFVVQAYVDSGYIVDDGGALRVLGGFHYISSTAAPGLTQPYTRIKSAPADGLRTVIENLDTSIGYYVTDYKVISDQFLGLPGQAASGRNPELARQVQTFYNNETATIPHHLERVKGGSELRKRVSLGSAGAYADDTIKMDGADVSRDIGADIVRVNGPAALSRLLLGSGGDGLRFSAASGNLHFLMGSAARWQINASSHSLSPGIDNAYSLGAAALRPTQVFAVAGTINTSDAREKTDPVEISDEVLDAWGDVRLIAFQWLSSVEEKGDGARLHVGVIAQQVGDAFANRGLDAFRYGLLCFDAWDGYVTDDGLAIDGGDRWGIRADQCLFVEAAYQRRRMDRIEARIEALAVPAGMV